jgi:mannose-6-phosphate isomerase
MLPLYPLRFVPIFKSALWGGRRIADMLPGAPAQGPISEAWLVSDVDDNVSSVADGPLAGMSLRELMQTRRADLGLPHHANFPLLVKIIDAAQPLSVQVHPNDEQARRLENQPRGKTEAWYVVHAEPGARIYAGFKPGVDREKFMKALAAGRIEDTLHSFEAKAGDCVFLPAGTIHAAGAGLTIFEVQQTSDLTYRLHDWGRVDAKTGRPRELHVDKALECLDFGIGPIHPHRALFSINDPNSEARGSASTGDMTPLCRHFGLTRSLATVDETFELQRCRILFVISGRATLRGSAGEFGLTPGTVWLIPPGEYSLRQPADFECAIAFLR